MLQNKVAHDPLLLNPNEPFSPFNLLAAGVPETEINWFVGLPRAGQNSVLTTTRGRLLLERLRSVSHKPPFTAAASQSALRGN
jgi:hypothetical protein